MRLIRFFSQVAFISNLFFLMSIVLQFTHFVSEESLVSTIVVLGYFLAVFVFNPLANIFCLLALSFRKNFFSFVPKWLVLANFIFLLVQILYIILFLNDTIYN